jgi:phytoene dehydrogenase-like protein
MFSLGRACLPRGGMEAIPKQLAAGLPAGTILLDTPVKRVQPGLVVLADGRELAAKTIVMATEGSAAVALLPEGQRGAVASRGWKSTRMVAFAATQSPLSSPTVVVSAEEGGPIDNITVPSDVAGGYAPPGAAVVYGSIRQDWQGHDGDLHDAVRRQAAGWFGQSAHAWRHLKTVRVDRALPDESPAARRTRQAASQVAPGLFICGDHCTTASINGALASGRACAESVISAGG